MALANIACLLARTLSDDKKVLVIDWDLEAPGLHYYLLPPNDPSLKTGHRGVVELFSELQNGLKFDNIEDSKDFRADTLLDQIDFKKFIVPTRDPNVVLMPAGSMDDSYQSRLTAINWQNIYDICPTFYQSLAVQLASEYSIVLIDSRTGMTDTSNICTSLLPDKLVVVFTPNRQSLSGVESLVRQSTDYRRYSSDLRPLMIYPLLSRIDGQYDVLRKVWRNGDAVKGIEGYEQQFTRILQQGYGLTSCDLFKYFEEVQIQHSPEYSYGEPVAALDPETSDRFSLLRSYQSLLNWLSSSAAPWEDPELARDRLRLESLKEELESGNYGGSEKRYIDLLRENVNLSMEIFGDKNASTIEATQRLIEASLLDVSDRPSAIEYLEKLRHDFPSMPPALRWSTADCFLRSAATLRRLGDDRAIKLNSELQALLEADSDFNARIALSTFLAIARRLYDKGALSEARLILEMLNERAVNISNGTELRAGVLSSLADTLRDSGDREGALKLYNQLLELLRDDRPEENADTLGALSNIAYILNTKGELKEAVGYQERVVELSKRVFGERDSATLEATSKLAATLQKLGQSEGDEDLLERARQYSAEAKATDERDTPSAASPSLQEMRVALEEAQEALRSARTAAEREPGNLQCQRDLSVALRHVADTQLWQGKRDLALQTASELLSVERARAAAEPENLDQQEELISTLMYIGDVRSELNMYRDALIDYLEASTKSTALASARENANSGRTNLAHLQMGLRERIENTRLQTVAAGRM